MPTEWREDGFEFVIRSNEPRFEPPHVHVFKAGEEVKISLGTEDEAPRIIGIWMKDRDAAKVLRIVAEKQDYFLGVWRGRHG
jgi:hypothetical protein